MGRYNPIIDGRKKCFKCGETKLTSEFHLQKGRPNGVRAHCKECRKKEANEYRLRPDIRERYRKQTRMGRRDYKLRMHYDINLIEYNRLFDLQKGVCVICGKPETRKNQYGLMQLSVDHNHETGKVRGLLCQRCNHTLGAVEENNKILKNMINYLMGRLCPN